MFVSSNSLQDVLPYFKRKLHAHLEESEIESVFFLICEHEFGISRLQARNHDKRLTESELLRMRDYVSRLMKNEPIQYILNEAFFYGLKFKLNHSVLIPRPETEELVHIILKDHAAKTSLRILDVGSGSGCIPVSLKKNIPQATVFAVDISEAAIKITLENAALNSTIVDARVCDVFSEAISQFPNLDILVSNPPYITNSEKKDMLPNVLEYEPENALFVPDDEPLKYYKRLLDVASSQVKKSGMIYFEINENMGDLMMRLCREFNFPQAEILKDLTGKDRFLRIVR